MWRYTYLEARSIGLPAGRHGAALEVRYRIGRSGGGDVPHLLTIHERIRVLVDPYQVAGQFRSGPDQATNGLFNDLYRLVSRNALPEDFRFEVEQTYTADNQLVEGKNKVVYTPSSVLLYLWEGGRWRLRGRGAGRQ